MPLSRNMLFLFIGVLTAAVAALSWRVYEDNRQQAGVQVTIGEAGIEKK